MKPHAPSCLDPVPPRSDGSAQRIVAAVRHREGPVLASARRASAPYGSARHGSAQWIQHPVVQHPVAPTLGRGERIEAAPFNAGPYPATESARSGARGGSRPPRERSDSGRLRRAGSRSPPGRGGAEERTPPERCALTAPPRSARHRDDERQVKAKDEWTPGPEAPPPGPHSPSIGTSALMVNSKSFGERRIIVSTDLTESR